MELMSCIMVLKFKTLECPSHRMYSRLSRVVWILRPLLDLHNLCIRRDGRVDLGSELLSGVAEKETG
jgi:hypothetical protein